MDTNLLRTQLKRAGYTIKSNGVVTTAKNLETRERPQALAAFVGNSILRLVDGHEIDITSIIEFRYSNKYSPFELITYNGTFETIPGEFSYADMEEFSENVFKTPMPKTDSAMNDIFSDLYPNYKEQLYYDDLLEKEMIDISMFDETQPKGTFKPFDEPTEYLYYDNIERKLAAYGCEGTPPSTIIRYRSLVTKINETHRNSFKEWVLSEEWDGVPRVDTWFQQVFFATAPPLENVRLSDHYLAKVARAWFVGGISRIFEPTQCDVIPILISLDQGAGKTSGLEYTAGGKKWYTSTSVDISARGGVDTFLNGVRGKIVVELGEGNTLKAKNQGVLKDFISKKSDQYRKPYAKREGEYPRHFIMAVTSNFDELLTDTTGNRRYFPVYTRDCDRGLRTPYDAQQVWAEAYVMYKAGETSYILNSWFPGKLMQEYALQENAMVDTIDAWLDDPENGYTRLGSKVCQEDIMQKFFHYSPHTIPTKEHINAWNEWKSGTKGWVRVTHPYKMPDGRSVRGFERTKPPGKATVMSVLEDKLVLNDEVKKMIDDAEIQAQMVSREVIEQTAAELYADPLIPKDFVKWCIKNNVRNEGEEFPTNGLSMVDLMDWKQRGLVAYDEELEKYFMTSRL